MNSDPSYNFPIIEYVAAGGVVLYNNKVLVLERPERQEIRLPKGHVEAGEALAEAALREVREESGYLQLVILADLGVQRNEFNYDGRHILRQEHFFLMALEQDLKTSGEAEFRPKWLPLEDAIQQLTFQVEKEWARRAQHKVKTGTSTATP